MQDGRLETLSEFFALQDRVVSSNGSAAPTEFDVIERGLRLGWAVTLHLNGPTIVPQRRAIPTPTHETENIIMNLLHSAFGGLVNAVRLTLYGAHPDALCLLRGSFEAVYHAEYFLHNQADAREWDSAGKLTDLQARRRALRAFANKNNVRGWLEAHDVREGSRSRLYHELSTYGTHANPLTVALRGPSSVPGMANLGFVSSGRREATRLCASHSMHVLKYLLANYFEGFPKYLDQDQTLVAEFREFETRFFAARNGMPGHLSLAK